MHKILYKGAPGICGLRFQVISQKHLSKFSKLNYKRSKLNYPQANSNCLTEIFQLEITSRNLKKNKHDYSHLFNHQNLVHDF